MCVLAHPVVWTTAAWGPAELEWGSSAAIFPNQIHVLTGWAIPASLVWLVIDKGNVDGRIFTFPTRGAKGGLIAILIEERLLEIHFSSELELLIEVLVLGA